jgi:drug/metabolite transporter (DMT)-like permease
LAHHPEESLPGPKNRARDAGWPSPLLLIFAAALVWSTGGLFIKWSTLGAVELSFGRALFAAVTVALFTRREGYGFNRLTAITSILYAALLLCFVIATKLTTAANAIFLQYTAPVYLLVLEPLVYKERFRIADLLTVIACVAGMSLFFLGRLETRALTGNLVALCSGLCMALYFLLLRHPHSQRINRASSVIYGNLLLALVTGALMLFAGFSPASLSGTDLFIVVYLGVVQLGLGYTLFTLGIARGVRSLQAGIIGYIEPVLNPVWVFLFLGERPSAWAILGGAIIITAVVLHTIRGKG